MTGARGRHVPRMRHTHAERAREAAPPRHVAHPFHAIPIGSRPPYAIKELA